MAGRSLISVLESIEGGNEANLSDALEKILSECGSDNEVAADLVNCGILPAMAALVTAVPSCQGKIADIVATLARADVARSPAVQAGLVPLLLGLLHHSDRNTVRNSLRALGNICFDNDEGREAVLRGDGVSEIGRIIHLEAQRETLTEDDMAFLKAASGCVLNMMAGYNAVAEAAIAADIPASLVQIIRQHGSTDLGLCRVLIMALDSLLEGSQEQGADALREAGAVTVIVRLLGAVEDSSIKELVIETLTSAARNELWQLALASQGCATHLLRQFKLDEERPVSQSEVSSKVMDLIVMLLTGDESLKILFSSGNGPILPVVCNWLQSEDQKVLSSGGLAVGNMARSDDNCAILLQKDVLALLLAVLEKYSSAEEHIPVLHGTLSALRNLSMPSASKAQLASRKIYEKVLPFIDHMAQPVQLKALGTLRLMVDGQEHVAVTLGTQVTFCTRLVELSSSPDVGVSSEAQRLLAAIIKNSKTDDVGNTLLSAGVVSAMISLAESQHAIMVHEAIIALNILLVACKDAGVSALREGGVVDVVRAVEANTSHSTEVRSNAQTLLTALN